MENYFGLQFYFLFSTIPVVLWNLISDKMMMDIFQAMTVNTSVWIYQLDTNETHSEKDGCEISKNATRCFEQILEVAQNICPTTTPRFTNHQNKTNKICGVFPVK